MAFKIGLRATNIYALSNRHNLNFNNILHSHNILNSRNNLNSHNNPNFPNILNSHSLNFHNMLSALRNSHSPTLSNPQYIKDTIHIPHSPRRSQFVRSTKFKQKIIRIGKIGGRCAVIQLRPKAMKRPNTKAINGANLKVTCGVRIKMLEENGDRALPEGLVMQGLRILGNEIKMLQVHGDRMLTKVGDSIWGAGGIKVQKDGPVVHGTRVLGRTTRNQPT